MMEDYIIQTPLPENSIVAQLKIHN